MTHQVHVQVRRVYDTPEHDDGARVLVDRIWPRGLTKTRAELHEWCKTVAPSTELRKWYGHDPDRFAEFARATRSSWPNRSARTRWRICGSWPPAEIDLAHRDETTRDQRGAGAGRAAPRLIRG